MNKVVKKGIALRDWFGREMNKNVLGLRNQKGMNSIIQNSFRVIVIFNLLRNFKMEMLP